MEAKIENGLLRPSKWTLLLTGDNHGLVGEFGQTWEAHPAHYERVNVYAVEAGAAPAGLGEREELIWDMGRNSREAAAAAAVPDPAPAEQPSTPVPPEFGASSVITPEYRAAQQAKNEAASTRLHALSTPVPREGGNTRMEALCAEAEKLAPILHSLCEGGGEERGVDIYADSYQPGDGDVFVTRAAAVLTDLAHVARQDQDYGLLKLTCEQLKARVAAADAHIERLEEVARQDQAAPTLSSVPQAGPIALWELESDGWETIDGVADFITTLPVGTRLYYLPDGSVSAPQAERAAVPGVWDAVPQAWNDLYVAIAHMMARLGADGEIDARSDDADRVMAALYVLDGGVVCKRALELHEKAHMPLFNATDLALREVGPPPTMASASSVAPAAQEVEPGSVRAVPGLPFADLASAVKRFEAQRAAPSSTEASAQAAPTDTVKSAENILFWREKVRQYEECLSFLPVKKGEATLADVKAYREREYLAKRDLVDAKLRLSTLVAELRHAAAQAAPAEQRDAVPDDEALRDAIAEGLRGLYGCGRVWSAWSVGTMTEDDFYPAEESDECIGQMMDAIRALRSTSTHPGTPSEGAGDE